MKELSEELSTSLSIISTNLFIEGQLPQDWKDAIVTPLQKKEKKSLQITIIQLVWHVLHVKL